MERISVFKRFRSRPLTVCWWEIRGYTKFLKKYFLKKILQSAEGFEAGKGMVVEGLVAKRGRYMRPFLHTGMVGLFLVGLLLAPVISSVANEEENVGRGGAILGMNMGMMETTTSVSIKPRGGVVTYIVSSG
ncbi:MAG: hypothetical protein U9Q63_04080, partial [Patescibacteria group bacterium]|nr:hypothetical protein [Patescibacteria group bacterium]